VLRRMSSVVLAVATMVAGFVSPSVAAGLPADRLPCPDGEVWNDGARKCVEIGDETSPGDPGGSGGGSGSGGGERVCVHDGQVIECRGSEGVWSDSRQCYVSVADPQPGKGDPVWEGHADGVILQCSPLLQEHCIPIPASGTLDPRLHYCMGGQFWAPSAPGGGDPAVAAQEAVAVMGLRAPVLGLAPAAPSTLKGSMGIVNANMWMWAADPGPHTTGPITVSASAGGASVTATGTLEKIVWDMGDGNTVTCTSPGTPWTQNAERNESSPDCGYVYRRSSANQPDKTYTMTATAYWSITWNAVATKDSGTIHTTVSRTTDYPVGEIQALNIPDED
jgi:hypothetical protein